MVTGHEALVPAMTNHPKDGHALAASVRADAAVIVTANRKDFPPSALGQIAAHRNPAISADQFLSTFKKTVPRFADAVREPLVGRLPF
jgi:hypothetical protein